MVSVSFPFPFSFPVLALHALGTIMTIGVLLPPYEGLSYNWRNAFALRKEEALLSLGGKFG